MISLPQHVTDLKNFTKSILPSIPMPTVLPSLSATKINVSMKLTKLLFHSAFPTSRDSPPLLPTQRQIPTEEHKLLHCSTSPHLIGCLDFPAVQP